MLRIILESTLGPMSNVEFAEIMDLATTDIKINRFDFGKRTSLADVVEIARSCLIALSKEKVA